MKNIIFSFLILLFAINISYSQQGWIQQNSGTSNQLIDIFFISESTGWICGWYGTILKTTNSGADWLPYYYSSPLGFQRIIFNSVNDGWIIGQKGLILHSTNGGETWSERNSGTLNLLMGIHFISPLTGWIVGAIGTVLKTVDGGNTWQSINIGATVDLTNVHFLNSQTGLISGNSGKVYKTTNGGQNWFQITAFTGNNLTRTFFTDQSTGWITSHNGGVFKTTDAGSNWYQQISSTSAWLLCSHFISQSTGWIVGDTGVIIKTINGGQNWNRQASGVSTRLQAVAFINQFTGYAVGYNGVLLKTTTGGTSPAAVPVLISPDNNSVNISLTPTLLWNSSAGAEYYHVQVSTTGNFLTITDSASVTATQRTIPSGKLLPNTPYYWRVRAHNSYGHSNWSGAWIFTTMAVLPPPVLISPANGTLVFTYTPTLDWESVTGAANYLVQVSTSPEFNIITDSATITASQYTIPYGKLSNSSVYNWRVRAMNSSGNGMWSSMWHFTLNITGISSNQGIVPEVFALYQNYPNPFNPETKITFDVPELADVNISVYDLTGREVRFLANGKFSPGQYETVWNASGLSSGIYFIRMTSDNFTSVKKLILLR